MTASKIEWTDRSDWNPIRGCTRVSPGCGGPGPHGGCYAEAIAARFSDPGQAFHGFAERTKSGGRWTGRVDLQDDRLTLPLRWRKPAKIFVSSTSDLFHEKLPDEAIDRIFAVMALCPQHTFQILTKRAKRMREYLTHWPDGAARFHHVWHAIIDLLFHSKREGHGWSTMDPGWIAADTRAREALGVVGNDWTAATIGWPLKNVWLGVSCEDQARADERIPELLATPAAVRFISAEPLLGSVRLSNLYPVTDDEDGVFVEGVHGCVPRIDWTIAGGESGPNARPMHPDWARSLRDQCQSAGVPFFFKQWGEWAPHKVQPGGDLGSDVRADRVRIVHPSARSNVEISIATGGYSTEPGSRYMARVGKKAAAGRLLDGREWSEMPEQPR